MLTFPVTRRQSDMKEQPRVTLDTSDRPDVARQEFKDEADINILLTRFGVSAQPRPVVYGDFDYTIDLQTALDAIEQAETGYNRLPPALRAKYPDWTSVILALADGAKASEIRDALKQKPPSQEPDNATRSGTESSGERPVSEPATS